MRALLICGLLLMAPLTQVVLAQEVYRWTDEHGQVHFGTRPPPCAGEPVMTIQPPAAESLPDPQDRSLTRQRLLQSYQRERELKQAAEQKRADQERLTLQRCRRLTVQWRRLSHPGPIYVKEPDGQRRYLSDDQRRQEKAALLDGLREYCDGPPE